MTRMWMVRAAGGRLFDAFLAHGVAALGWRRLAALASQAESRQALIDAYAALEPALPPRSVVSGASQVWRFAHELQQGDAALTYDPRERRYRVGCVTGPAVYRPEWMDAGMPLARPVEWWPGAIARDALPPGTRNALGPTQTVFRVGPAAARRVLALAAGSGPAAA